MPLSKTPDLSSARRLTGLALGVSVIVALLLVAFNHDISRNLGDTDDALRLVQVRDLLGGRGWYDQAVVRFQPHPQWLHWSRLLDGGIAGFDRLLQLFMPPAAAEWGTRFVWPLLWIFPVSLAGLSSARSLGGSAALVVMAMLLITDPAAYIQFIPGRIDHHDVQVTFTAAAFAFALQRRNLTLAAVLSAAATTLGLAIGLEALPYQALIGASFAFRALTETESRRATRAYGFTLALLPVVVFALQTPPWRWSLSFCDAMGLNTVVGLSLSGLVVATISSLPVRWPVAGRAAVALALGAVAGGAYLALDPACIHGPLGAVDPRVRPFWFDRVQELRPWPFLFKHLRFMALTNAAVAVLAAISALTIVLRPRGAPLASTVLTALLVAVSAIGAWQVVRAEDYLFWLGLPVISAGLARLAARLKDRLVVYMIAGLLLAPTTLASAATGGFQAPSRTATEKAAVGGCTDVAAFRQLAALPPGLVIAEIDLGPHILANTPQAVVVGPYHRMTDSLLLTHLALDGDTPDTLPMMQQAHVTYVVDCPVPDAYLTPKGLRARLRQGKPPPWLQPLSLPSDRLQIYKLVAPTADPTLSAPTRPPARRTQRPSIASRASGPS